MGASSKWLVIVPSQGTDGSSTLLAPTIAKKRYFLFKLMLLACARGASSELIKNSGDAG